MNPRLLLTCLENSGVVFAVENGRLSVDAPSGVLTDEDRAALIESKADTLEVLKRREEKLQVASERGFIATYSKEPGYISLHDPLAGEWHDFPHLVLSSLGGRGREDEGPRTKEKRTTTNRKKDMRTEDGRHGARSERLDGLRNGRPQLPSGPMRGDRL